MGWQKSGKVSLARYFFDESPVEAEEAAATAGQAAPQLPPQGVLISAGAGSEAGALLLPA